MKLRDFWFRVLAAFAGAHDQAPGVDAPRGARETVPPVPPKSEEPPHFWKSHGGARH
ncbi:MAG: hypothetical protein GX580_15335 [Candidatus Hydrogenedens sp.]|nr:hypothetical protein [Candidatus Hydrogenedens sp.]